MRRTKSPALTSPWKIGFFVALLLVFVSIGVAYYVVDHFNLTGTLFDRNWLDKNEWLGLVRGTGFIFDMLPLAGLVVVTSMISFLAITSAVKRYKRYLDSGFDYKNLLSSLKEADLEDKTKIERIKNHPELQRLLLGLAEMLEEKNLLLGEREAALETRVTDALNVREKELADGFTQECDRLAAAIDAGAPELGGIELSNPGLRKLGEILCRDRQARQQREEQELAASYGDLRKTSDVIQSKLHEIVDELNSSREGALDIEEQLKQLAGSGATESQRDLLESAKNEVRTIVSSFRSLEELNATLDLLSEETRGIAISSALHAGSGVGTQDDLVRLAEEVKGVAERFRHATRRFIEISAAFRTAAGTLDEFAGGSPGLSGEENPEEALANVRSRVALWVERIVVLSDKIMNAHESYGVAVSSLPDAKPEQLPTQSWREEPSADDAAVPQDDGFETLDRGATLFPDKSETSEESGEAEAGGGEAFEEMAGERPGTLDDFEDANQAPADLDRFGIGANDEPSLETTSRNLPSETEEDRTPSLEAELRAADTGRTGGDQDETSFVKEPTASVEDEDVVDLYDLGAVDYDPVLHK